jgi:alpha-D-ribose 1-methylphosphonate 5-phosphate C-P lyase
MQFSNREIQVFTVWVGGVEVTDELFNLNEADEVVDDWKDRGYDDVGIMTYFRREQ